jgi:low affinity Fe/Cu permease
MPTKKTSSKQSSLSQPVARKPFASFARSISSAAGHPIGFVAACLVIVAWALSGQFFGYSDTWQLVINTGTTIVTFLMVFLIQNTQNRDSVAMQIKLDELIRTDSAAHNVLLDLEELTEKELELLRKKYEQLAEEARGQIRKGKKDKGVPEIF